MGIREALRDKVNYGKGCMDLDYVKTTWSYWIVCGLQFLVESALKFTHPLFASEYSQMFIYRHHMLQPHLSSCFLQFQDCSRSHVPIICCWLFSRRSILITSGLVFALSHILIALFVDLSYMWTSVWMILIGILSYIFLHLQCSYITSRNGRASSLLHLVEYRSWKLYIGFQIPSCLSQGPNLIISLDYKLFFVFIFMGLVLLCMFIWFYLKLVDSIILRWMWSCQVVCHVYELKILMILSSKYMANFGRTDQIWSSLFMDTTIDQF
jgi:hypothetical protein